MVRSVQPDRDPQPGISRRTADGVPQSVAAEVRKHKREDLLRATEAVLDPIVAATRRDQRRPQGQAKIALRVGKVIGKYKMAKHFDLEITEESFGYRRKPDAIAREAALDGLYIVRTSLPESELDAPGRCPPTRV